MTQLNRNQANRNQATTSRLIRNQAIWKYARILTVLFIIIAVLISVPPTIQAQEGVTQHTVQPGENLFRIALRYGLTTEQLAAANGIYDPSLITVGQVLIIPAGAVIPGATPTSTSVATVGVTPTPQPVQPALEPPAPVVTEPDVVTAPPTTKIIASYVVQSGDTLLKIAEKFDISTFEILSANNITNPNLIYPGENIVIPEKLPPGATPPPPVAPAAPQGNKVILVVLGQQMVYAYENNKLVRSTLASTGLPYTPTVQGTYAVYVKYPAQLMYGPGYYLPNVQWVMYFYEGYGLHGTYWHENFGQPMSHGCVNLPNAEAEWLFNWAEVGTPVIVRYT